MNRRGFLKRGAMAAIGAAAAVALPSVIQAAPLAPQRLPFQRLPYYVDSVGDYCGISRSLDVTTINKILPKLIESGHNTVIGQSRFLRKVKRANV